ncbi:hypothetical protein NDU88_006153 [Pleurodeles waltl]|uniref:Myb-like domain-containing protein n=1 Tax=Pleurodeles waltl TaxID=8319 RepID=A0AAV7X0P1_PLEWA|nr:hypothetical protein NDU88_006153 [Pleurodeles waltl]
MATVLVKFQETQRLQEEQYLGFREELKSINTTLGTIAGVLKDLVNTRRDPVAQQGAPDTSLDDELPNTSAGASGQEALPQDHNTSTPPLADGEPPCKRSLRSRKRQRTMHRPSPRNQTTLIVILCPTLAPCQRPPGKDIWRAIAKDVRALGGPHRRSTHCRKRWEDIRRWSKKTGESQLGMASQRRRGARRTMTPLMFRILAVAHLEVDGRLRASQQPQGGEYRHIHLIQLALEVSGWGRWAVGSPRPGRVLQARSLREAGYVAPHPTSVKSHLPLVRLL